MRRRSFLKGVAATAPVFAMRDLLASQGSAKGQAASAAGGLHVVGAGEDRLGHPHSLGMSSIAFKVAGSETGGGMLLIEHTRLMPGGPPLHMHPHQEELFYVLEGGVAFQVGEQRLELAPGECVLAPRGVPHAFSAVKPASRMMIAFTPAGKMEQYFLDAEQDQEHKFDREFMERYDLKWVGPSPFAKAPAAV